MPVPVLLLIRALTAGGSERQLAEMARSLDRRHWTPHVGCFHDEGERAADLQAAQVPVVRFPVHSFGSPSLLAAGRQMGRYLRQHKIGLVHSFDVPSTVFAVPCGRWYRTPVVLSSQRAFRELVSPNYRKLLRATDRLADGVVVNCEALRRHLVEDEGVPPARVHLCYNGLDLTRFPASPRERRPELAGASLVIGCVCVLRPEKGLPELVRSFAEVRSLRPGLRLVLVGSGPLLPELQNLVRELGIGEQVFFAPSTADVAPWMRSIDIFVLASHSEALSNSLMEASASRCATVASRVGGNPELVEADALFPRGDVLALAALLRERIENPARREESARRARAMVESRFALPVAAARMGEIYRAAWEARRR
jgi:L-malate glycosyltransferase